MKSGNSLEALTLPPETDPSGRRDRGLGQAPREGQPLLSIGVLSGFAMFWIIGGAALFRGLAKALPGRIGDPWALQLQPVPWQGLHLYDLIWPLFLFVMGAGLRLSADRRPTSAVRRALVLFALGTVVQGNLLAFDLSKFHPFAGILHGVAAGYLIAALVMAKLPPKRQAAAMAAGLLAYWGLLMFIPVPGFGSGVLTPEANAAGYVDRLLLGRLQYGMNTWLLGYLGFASTIVLGGLAGEVLLARHPPRTKILGLCGVGAALLVAGLLWSLRLPIVRPLWTGSYVLVCGGISFLILALFYSVIDVLGFRKWAFGFTVIGLNAIAAYVATALFDFRHIGNIFVGDLLSRAGVWAELLEASATFATVWLILYWMYRTKTFVRL